MMRVPAWRPVTAITALTLVPPTLRPVSGLPHAVDHVLVFFATGAALALAYPRRIYALAVSCVAFAAILELLQMTRPRRHASVRDFVIDAAAMCARIAGPAVIQRMQRRNVRVPL